jgi:hypothetical protein
MPALIAQAVPNVISTRKSYRHIRRKIQQENMLRRFASLIHPLEEVLVREWPAEN